MNKTQLSKSRQQLLDAIQRGVEVRYYPPLEDTPPHYARGDDCRIVTLAANALIREGLVKKVPCTGARAGHTLEVAK